MSTKHRVYEIVEAARPGDRAGRAFGLFIVSLIALNLVAIVLESVEALRRACPAAFRWVEVVSVLAFSVEYALRLWSCTTSPKYASPILGRVRFALTPLALIDLLAVLPFYLPFLGVDLRFVRAVRLLRLFRVAKLGRYSQAVRTLGRVFVAKKEELGITVFVMLLLLVIASCLMYFVEHDSQPEAFSSIPATMWWSVTTLTTVGYGDVCPTTLAGKAVAGVLAILGIGMFALPTGILGAGFVEEIQKHKHKGRPTVCPHCGKEIPP